jgi:transcriptional regulator with XRE-family HTH domain
MTTREVQDLSRRIADNRRCDDFYISHSSLSEIENSESQPSLQKLYTLSEIYQTSFLKLLHFYKIDLEEISKTPATLPYPRTQLIHPPPNPLHQSGFPATRAPTASLDETNLLSGMLAEWGEMASAVQNQTIRGQMYGYIGVKDFTLYPMVRPGSVVQIDGTDTKVRQSGWRNEFERPIYFLQLREGFACGWCQLDGKELIVIPHPLSRVSIRRFRHPDDAEVLGRVCGLAMPLPPPPSPGSQGKLASAS